jgi:mRNA interferase MazF
MGNEKPVRGEIWDVALDPVLGHEQGGRRPALVVSVDQFNQGSSGLVIVVPITSKDKNIRSRVAIEAGEGGCKTRSFAMCEAVRSISLERLTRRRGMVADQTMQKVQFCLRILLGL